MHILFLKVNKKNQKLYALGLSVIFLLADNHIFDEMCVKVFAFSGQKMIQRRR